MARIGLLCYKEIMWAEATITRLLVLGSCLFGISSLTTLLPNIGMYTQVQSEIASDAAAKVGTRPLPTGLLPEGAQVVYLHTSCPSCSIAGDNLLEKALSEDGSLHFVDQSIRGEMSIYLKGVDENRIFYVGNDVITSLSPMSSPQRYRFDKQHILIEVGG